MKKIQFISKLSVVSIIFLIPIFQHEVKASNSIQQNNVKLGVQKDYQEPAGPHLMVNVTGVDEEGNDVLYPHYTEFPIKPGTRLTKEKIKYYVEWALGSAKYGKYQVVELDSNAKIKVTYYNKKIKDAETKYFPVSDRGFIVPDLSDHIENPSFNLITDVIIEEKYPY